MAISDSGGIVVNAPRIVQGLSEPLTPYPTKFYNFLRNGFYSDITFARADTTNCATVINAAGTIQVVSANVPRIDYDPSTLSAKGFLIEETRANLFINNASAATQDATVTATAYTISFYGTGKITLSGVATSAVSGTGAYPTRTTATFTPTAGTLSMAVSGSVVYPQLEAGSFATSVIVTKGSAATRAAETAKISSPSWLSTIGAFAVESICRGMGTDGPHSVVSLDDASTNNRIQIRRYDGAGSIAISNYKGIGGGSTIFSVDAANGTFPMNTTNRSGVSFIIGSQVFTAGTTIVGTSASNVLPASFTEVQFCVPKGVVGDGGSGSNFNGWIRKFWYWNTGRTGNFLKQVT